MKNDKDTQSRIHYNRNEIKGLFAPLLPTSLPGTTSHGVGTRYVSTVVKTDVNKNGVVTITVTFSVYYSIILTLLSKLKYLGSFLPWDLHGTSRSPMWNPWWQSSIFASKENWINWNREVQRVSLSSSWTTSVGQREVPGCLRVPVELKRGRQGVKTTRGHGLVTHG